MASKYVTNDDNDDVNDVNINRRRKQANENDGKWLEEVMISSVMILLLLMTY